MDMTNLTGVWSGIRQLITSRTIYGGLILFLGAVGVKVPEGLDQAILGLGDNAMNLIGAALVLAGYFDRRPKPAAVDVKLGA